ncbi:class I SAM-dependent methyltransferase [Lichenihabitans sp. PAMC28606]|uniref:class I SAM-dependent methyltransferase n=1 Tax=Lichenihabitans sp. PAMC28606 TaxID=2880932 RepID=UPI001D0A4196|nr:class I SAM-dependent methyltransferase [Lichenihabitans sp. PAMC28606]UDL93317.1 class I SAM-dependent methyltransferase [Lichenihabitans sp. PAMC28606]
MSLDVVDLRSFYAAPLGRIAHRYVARTLREWWPNTTGMAVMGLGYAVPYLGQFRDEAVRVIGLMPAEQGVLHWPGTDVTSTALVEPASLPLPDGCIDRLVVVHLLEVAEHPREVLDEIWRVLAPGGRMIVVAPNRRGWWARVDTTPFGFGQPFSKSQLNTLLRDTLFSPERFGEALYVPPLRFRSVWRLAAMFEACGCWLGLPGAGLHVVEASKQLYRPIPLRKTAKRGIPKLDPVLAPVAGRLARRSQPSGRDGSIARRTGSTERQQR